MRNGLSRREALTGLAGSLLAGTALDAAGGQAPAGRQAPAAAAPVAAKAATPRAIGMVSRLLQWTDLDDAIALTKEAGFDAIEWNVRKGGHIAPERVEQDLPKAVARTRAAGLAATMITTSIQDAQSPYAESILRAMQAAGIRYYRGGEYFRYDYTKPLPAQVEALKPRLAGLDALNRKYGTTWAYHTHSAPGMIGGAVWDIWPVMKTFDPASMAFNFDIGHVVARNGAGWIDIATIVAPYIAALAVKDARWDKGPRGWRAEFVPVGEGMIELSRLNGVLSAANFAGPVNIHYEHSGLLGTDLGTWTLPISRARYLEIVRQDLAAVRTGLT